VKLSQRLLVITAVPLAFILSLIFGVAQMHDRVVSAEYFAERSDLVILQAQTLARALERAESSIKEYTFSGDVKLAIPYRQAAADIPDEADRLKQLVNEDEQAEAAAQRLARLAGAILHSLSRVRTLQTSGNINRLRGALLASSRLDDEFGARLDWFMAHERQAATIHENLLQQAWYQFDILLGGGAIAACLLTLALMGLVGRNMARRIALLGKQAERFAGSGEVGPALGGRDEVAQVDEAFHAMAAVLRERQATLAMYMLLAQHAREAMFFVRASDLQILEANAAAEAMYGYSRAELLSMRVTDLRDQGDLASLERSIAAAESGGVTYEARNRRKDGTIFPVEVSAQGAVVGGQRILVGIVRDVTERKQFERERQRYFDLSLDPMAIGRLDGRLLRVNAAFAASLGMSEADLLATPFVKLVHRADRKRLLALVRQLAAGAHVAGAEARILCSDGTYKDMVWDAVPAGDGELVYAVGRDVTQQKAAQAALALARDRATEASLLKSQFLASMSHEIRTPMNGVIGMTELLLSTALSPEQTEYATAIRESGAALLAIINEILDFSKLEAGKLDLDVTEFSPSAVAEGVVDLLASQARQKGLAMQSYVAPSVPRSVRGDAGRVRQVLMNLVGNAIKFTDAGSVTLRVSRAPTKGDELTLTFSVSDTGVGIPAGARARLFEPFVQADSSFSRRVGGTGLGLSICKRLVELMRGEIGFESEEGIGSTFTFSLPFAKAAAPVGDSFRTELRGCRALVVDDDPVAREIISAYLTSWGTQADCAGGEQALALARAAAASGDRYDIAIVDLRMPVMSGLDLAREIRSDPVLAATTLILTTAFDGSLNREDAKRAGFTACLTKPFKAAQLFMSVASAIRGGTATQRMQAQVPAIEQSAARPHPAKAMKLLIAEDNPIGQKLLLAQLRRLGVEAEIADTGDAVVQAVKKNDYSLVLMDCHMPGVDGFEATRRIRAWEAGAGRRTIIVAVTANAMAGDRETCIAAGMDDYLSKPVKLEALRALLTRWLPGLRKESA
jgi:PAS domain S-box-containing protein